MRQNIKDHSFQKRSTARCQASTVRPTAQGSQDHRGSRAGAAIGPLSATAGRSGKFPPAVPTANAETCSKMLTIFLVGTVGHHEPQKHEQQEGIT